MFSVGDDTGVAKLSGVWLVDSSVPQHMTYSKAYMKNFLKITPVDVHLADDGRLGTGDIAMSMKTAHGVKKGVLMNMWYISKLIETLVFSRKIYQGHRVSDF